MGTLYTNIEKDLVILDEIRKKLNLIKRDTLTYYFNESHANERKLKCMKNEVDVLINKLTCKNLIMVPEISFIRNDIFGNVYNKYIVFLIKFLDLYRVEFPQLLHNMGQGGIDNIQCLCLYLCYKKEMSGIDFVHAGYFQKVNKICTKILIELYNWKCNLVIHDFLLLLCYSKIISIGEYKYMNEILCLPKRNLYYGILWCEKDNSSVLLDVMDMVNYYI